MWGRRHFMTRRFDRLDGGDKLHMQSLGAMAHFRLQSLRQLDRQPPDEPGGQTRWLYHRRSQDHRRDRLDVVRPGRGHRTRGCHGRDPVT